MPEWDALRLGNLVSVRKGKLARLSPNPKDGFLPYLGAGALEGRIEAFAETSGAELATDKDVLMLWDGERSGLVGKGYEGVVASTVTRLTPKESVDTAFLFHALCHKFEWIQAHRTGTGVPHVPKDLCDILIVPIPKSAGEQRAIAAILDAADEAIAKTEALIAKLKSIKQGLLRDLLTRGLDDNGELRDTEKHPEQFKETPLGRFPVEWETPTVNDLSVHVGSGITPAGGSNVYKRKGVLFIRSQNVTFDGLLLDDVAYIDERTHQMMARSEIFAHDVLLNITGASIGRCCPMPEGLGPANVNQHVCAIRTAKPRRADAIVLSAILASFIGQRHIDRLNAGSNRQGLNYQQLRSFLIPWPKRESERDVMATRIESADSRVRVEEAYLSKLKAIKKGLMQDLLTGRVRVPAEKIAALSTG